MELSVATLGTPTTALARRFVSCFSSEEGVVMEMALGVGAKAVRQIQVTGAMLTGGIWDRFAGM